jgi:DegV family protein with EDD domain
MSILVVTDSTSDLPPDLAAAQKVTVIPAILVMGDKSLADGEGISRQEFYEQLPLMKNLPTTAAPASGTFEQTYEKLFSQGASQVLSIHLASALSGILNAAQSAARSFGKRVHVFDSQQVSMGLGFQALAAAEAAAQGLSLEQVLEHVVEFRNRLHLIAMLDSLEYVRRSGRVSWAKASLGSLLQIKPFVGVKEDRLAAWRAHARKGIERLYQMLSELGTLERLAILHTNAEAEARQMLADFIHLTHSAPLLVNVTSVIGTHVGPNALGFVAVTR